MKIALKYVSALFACSLIAGSVAVGETCNATKSASAKKSGCTASATEIVDVANKGEGTCSKGVAQVANKGEQGAKECSTKTAKTDCAKVCSVSGKEIVNVDNDGEKSPFYTVGSKVSDFSLIHAQSGEERSMSDLTGDKATVVVFWNKDCPYVEGARGASDAIQEFASNYAGKGVNVVAIDAGVNNSKEANMEYSKNLDIPLLLNTDSTIAAKFNARYTPQAFIVDNNMQVQYAGAFWTGSGDDVRMHAENAVKDILAGNTVAVPEARGVGCSVKYADGARPKAKAQSKPTT